MAYFLVIKPIVAKNAAAASPMPSICFKLSIGAERTPSIEPNSLISLCAMPLVLTRGKAVNSNNSRASYSFIAFSSLIDEFSRFKQEVFLILFLNRRQIVKPKEKIKQYREFIKQRAARIPLQYLTKTQGFMGLEFSVTPAVLIPRQDTPLWSVPEALDLAY